MKLAVIFGILLLCMVGKAEVGFNAGNQRTAVLSRGEIHVYCPGDRFGGPSSRIHICQREVMVEGEHDYFIGPRGIKADEVVLTARHQDGSSRTKKVAYDGTKGRSAKAVNLWILTLLQKPLLDAGENRVSYTLMKSGQTVTTGQFVASVRDGGRKICSRRGYYTGHNSNDCNNVESFCSRYFYENNYCL